jgi:hypothetical protein
MSARLEALARDKRLLVAQSSLCRLHLRRSSQEVRQWLPWKRPAQGAVAAPSLRRAAFGIVASYAGLERTAKALAYASRAILLAKLAGFAITYANRDRLSPASRNENP